MSKLHSRLVATLAPFAMAAATLFATPAQAQVGENFFVDRNFGLGFHPPCTGKVRQVHDITFEGVKTTAWNFAMVGAAAKAGASTRCRCSAPRSTSRPAA